MEDHEMPETAEKFVARGKAFYKKGDYREAGINCNKALRLAQDVATRKEIMVLKRKIAIAVEAKAKQKKKESGLGYYGYGSVYGQIVGICWKLHL
jgi:tetratricopeptide (TPR) repeat protein